MLEYSIPLQADDALGFSGLKIYKNIHIKYPEVRAILQKKVRLLSFPFLVLTFVLLVVLSFYENCHPCFLNYFPSPPLLTPPILVGNIPVVRNYEHTKFSYNLLTLLYKHRFLICNEATFWLITIPLTIIYLMFNYL